MNMIIGESGCGKTKKLIYDVNINNGILVCKNPAKMYEKAIAYGYTAINIISYEQFILHNSNEHLYYIHHLEELLNILNVAGFTLTKN